MISYDELDDEKIEDDLEEELLAHHQEKQEEKVDQVVQEEQGLLGEDETENQDFLEEDETEDQALQEDQTIEESYNDERPLDRPEEREITEVYREETAAEIAPNAGAGIAGFREPRPEAEEGKEEVTNEEDTKAAGKGVGALGIALSIVSLFFLPVIFSIAGIIFGAISAKKDHPGIGYTAIGIGAFSLIMSFFFAPFVS
ncbi:hypothetical protein CR203_01240 [Salipaludibacillus neizhouensis]|uniref:DUF4190 domain-containing protein n=1 Tax=Salipaludibacillus neizhouensis TaxID=885475 RepID=A0A3A9KVS2_9BACI|nr:hypothetical protein [Salipaludibacillus neizhouensis]RKL68706.1 hypothetical protein CR203_01240 [Salipaludibacillus neizhouensis]